MTSRLRNFRFIRFYRLTRPIRSYSIIVRGARGLLEFSENRVLVFDG